MKKWWMGAVFYEMYVDKFAGTFPGLTDRLEYFNYLGVNALHILPHFPSPMIDDGYDVADYKNIRTELGSLNDFEVFVKEAQAKGINILIDLVLNHVSEEHFWFIEARSSKNNKYRDYFIWSDEPTHTESALNPFSDFKNSNWIWNEQTKDYYYATFYPQQPDLQWGNPKIFAEFQSIVDFWVERGVKGFRLDAVPYLSKQNTLTGVHTDAHTIIHALRRHLDIKYKSEVLLLAEVGDTLEEAKKYFGASDECQMVYHFALTAEIFLGLARNDFSRVYKMIQEESNPPAHCAWGFFVRNHDEVWTGSLTLEEQQEVRAFLDPHNQYPFLENTRTSIRLGSAFEHEIMKIKDIFSILFSLGGVPLIYYGDEIGMKNLPPLGDGKDSRKCVRGVFDWGVVEQMRSDPGSLLNAVASVIHHRQKRNV